MPLIRLSHERYINTTRCSCVNYSGFLSIKGSSSHTCSCGVSQGSVLGLLLFVLYTTPLSTLISSLSLNHHLYADDTQLFFSFYPSDLESSITYLQNVLQQISSWMTVNLLTLNSSKTEYLVCIFFRKEMSLTVSCDVSCMIGLCNNDIFNRIQIHITLIALGPNWLSQFGP